MDEKEIDEGQPSVLKGWDVDCKHIRSGGLVGEKEATASQLEEVRQLLDLEGLSLLSCKFDFAPYAKRHYLLTCSFEAKLKQASIYSLDLVEQSIASEFVTELYRRREDEEGGQFFLQENDDDVMDQPDQDFFDGEVIELGRLVYEFLSLELDRFTQSEGERDKWRAQKAKDDEVKKKKESPFAVLKSLSLEKKK